MGQFLNFLRDNAHWLSVGAMLTFLSSFGQTFFISIFGGVIREDFGLTNGEWGLIYTLGTTGSAAVMIWAGTLTDRFRVRHLGVVVLILLALMSLTMALAGSVAMLVVAIFGLRLFGQGMTAHMAAVAMARWFVATRGRALSIAGLGISVGESLLPIVFVALMGAGLHWRWLWVVAAGIILLATPVIVRLLRRERTPQSMAEENSAPGMGGRHWQRMEVLRHWLFWICVPALLGPAAFGTAMFFHQVHLSEWKGWPHLGFVSLFPLFTAAAIFGIVASGWAVDRFGTGRVMPLYLIPFGSAFAVMAGADSLFLAGVALMLMGLGQGMNATVSSAFWAEYYGTRNLGAIKSAAVAVMVFGTAVGPGATGALIDAGLPFAEQMIGIALYFAAATVMVAWGVTRGRRDLPPRAAEVDIVSP